MAESESVHGIYVWSALVSAERLLSIMIGRPCMVKESDCSAPMPLPVSDEPQTMKETSSRKNQTASTTASESHSASASSSKPSGRSRDDRPYEAVGWSLPMAYFFHYLELSRLSQRVMDGLYNPHIRHQKWSSRFIPLVVAPTWASRGRFLTVQRLTVGGIANLKLWIEIQRKIEVYDKQLTQWTATLPAQFDPGSWKDHPYTEPFRAALAVLSYSTRAIINRPALCRTERQIANQSDKSVGITHDAAQRCVHSARAILQFLPGERKGTNLSSCPIWWVRICGTLFSSPSLFVELPGNPCIR